MQPIFDDSRIAAGPIDASSDETLLERSRRGEATAFAALAARYWDAVHRIAWQMVPDEAAAAKVAEAAFLAVLQAGEAFPAQASFKTSLYRVVMGESWQRLEDAPVAGAIGLARSSIAARFREAVQRLDALDRAALLLREAAHLSAEEAAAVLGITPASIRRRTHQATIALMGFVAVQAGSAWTICVGLWT